MNMEAALAAASPSEAQWVEGELVRSLMRTQRNTQSIGLWLIPIVVGVLWGDAQRAWLLTWAVFALGVAVARFWILARYERDVRSRGSAEHLAFFRHESEHLMLEAKIHYAALALHTPMDRVLAYFGKAD